MNNSDKINQVKQWYSLKGCLNLEDIDDNTFLNLFPFIFENGIVNDSLDTDGNYYNLVGLFYKQQNENVSYLSTSVY